MEGGHGASSSGHDIERRQREDELPTTLEEFMLALYDSGTKVPGQDHEISRIHFASSSFRHDRDPCAWRKTPELVLVDFGDAGKHLRGYAAVLKQDIPL